LDTSTPSPEALDAQDVDIGDSFPEQGPLFAGAPVFYFCRASQAGELLIS